MEHVVKGVAFGDWGQWGDIWGLGSMGWHLGTGVDGVAFGDWVDGVTFGDWGQWGGIWGLGTMGWHVKTVNCSWGTWQSEDEEDFHSEY
jgi:hypothetical protein